ncbi:MAG: PaaI family thioesterase [Thermomicrobiales bacterium]
MTVNGTDALPIVGRDDHHCFGCGRLNPHGLRLQFFRDERGVWAPFTPDQRHEGYTGIVHGGIISTVLDEVMAWALYAEAIWAVTARISVAFRKPVEVGVPTRAVGWIEADRGRGLDVVSELRRDADGLVLATATASFIRVPREQAAAWQGRYLQLQPETL